jgi:hypothetical protein
MLRSPRKQSVSNPVAALLQANAAAFRSTGLPAHLRWGTLLVCILVVLRAGAPVQAEAPADTSVRLQETTIARFTPLPEAAGIIGHMDPFVQSMSPLDRRFRLSAKGPVEAAEYLDFAKQQVLAWTEADMERLRPALQRLASRLEGLRPLWPPVVELIKTTGREEQGAPHCRGNAIVLPEPSLRGDDASLQRLLAHELFHILSRQEPARRARLYAILGFSTCDPIALPATLAARKITNPDAPAIDCVLPIQEEGITRQVSPVLLARKDQYESLERVSLFAEMQFRLLVVEKVEDHTVVANPRDPRLLDPAQCPDFHRQIGRNTGYIIHPEETLADNFVHLVFGTADLPDPWIVERLGEQLRR